MNIELREHIGKSLGRSGRQVVLPQYRIFIDGVASGYVGWEPGAKVNLTRRIGPLELAEITAEVGRQLKRDDMQGGQVPDVPADYFDQPEQEFELLDDDIDES